jgi:hypothetical protein
MRICQSGRIAIRNEQESLYREWGVVTKNKVEWLVSIPRCSAPERIRTISRLNNLVHQWEKYVGEIRYNTAADFEDFVEEAYRLDAALRAFTPQCIWLTTDQRSATHLVTDETRSVTELGSLPVYGLQPLLGHVSKSEADRLVGRYAETQTFLARSNRIALLATYDSEKLDASGLFQAVRFVARATNQKIFIKVRLPKYGIYIIEPLDPGASENDIDAAVRAALDLTLVHLDGMRNAFLIQSWAEIEYEYRLFVVGSQVVTGAGCIDEYSPLDNKQDFDTKIQKCRNANNPIANDPEIVGQLVAFGQQVVLDFAAEVPAMSEYVLDVAVINGKPGIVELNPLFNAGLYASDPYLVAEHLREMFTR